MVFWLTHCILNVIIRSKKLNMLVSVCFLSPPHLLYVMELSLAPSIIPHITITYFMSEGTSEN